MSSLTGRVFGHYHILDRIGHGGMATVYRAHDRKADREVAVKFISPALAQDNRFLKRFRREVKVVARLEHPRIVPIEDYGEQSGYAYLVMPLLNVGSLTDRLQERPLTLKEGGKLIEQISSALDYAHKQGVVHRDVKPANILLDEDGNAMLSDFGLARAHEHSVSLTGSALIGTPAYMAPEQARGEKVDARCDQYALGVILYQLATGTLPFEADTPLAVVLKHINEPIPSPRSRSPNVPTAVEQVIQKATAKDPDQRFQSVAEMNRTLQAALAHVRDPRANPAPTIELPRDDLKTRSLPADAARSRRKVQLAAAAVLLLLLILAMPVFAGGLMDMLERASSPAEGSLLNSADLNAVQLTVQAGTIEAMSTELAGSQVQVLEASGIQTAVVQTLIAGGSFDGLSGSGPSATPALDQRASPEATTTSDGTLILSPLAGQGQVPSPTPQPSSIPSLTIVAPASPTAVHSPTPTMTIAPTVLPTSTTPPTIPPTGTTAPTPPPTNTPTIAPTPVPSATPTIDACGWVSIGTFAVEDETASWSLSNGSGSSLGITRIIISWPAANVELRKVRLNNSLIWNGSLDSSPSEIGAGLKGNRTVPGGSTKTLTFEFAAPAQPSGYDLEVELDDSCQVFP